LNKQVGRASSSSSSTSPTPKPSAGAGADSGNKRSRSRLNKSITAGDEWEAAGEDEGAGGAGALNKRARVEVKPFVARWISSIKPLPSSNAAGSAPASGPEGLPSPTAEEPIYHCTYSLPESRTPELASFVEALHNNYHHQPPPPAANGEGGAAGSVSGSKEKEIKRRGEPVTRRYTEEEKEANRKRNEEGWRKVLLGAA
jgi:hypothetical protein